MTRSGLQRRAFAWLRLVASGLLAGTLDACITEPFLSCQTDGACAQLGEGARCEETLYCTVPDPDCPSGRRYHDRAGHGFGGECLAEHGTTTSPGSSSGDRTSVGSGADSTSTTAAADPTTTSSSSSGSSDGGSTGRVQAACTDQYGAAPEFMLCQQSRDECRFNAALANMLDCNAMCEMFGGTCITAFDNNVDPCVELNEAGCAAMTMSEICVCTRN